MIIVNAPQAKKLMHKKMYWDDISNRYIITRGGVLTDVHRNQLEFDHDQNYMPIRHYKNLRTTENK